MDPRGRRVAQAELGVATSRASVAIFLLLGACSAQGWGDPDPIVVAGAWDIVARDDPFGEPPAGWACDPSGWGTERFGLEESLVVRTQLCDFASFSQPITRRLHRGDRLFLRAWHDPLTAWDTEAGTVAAHLGLAIDGRLVWGVQVPIPNAGQIVLADVDMPVDVPAGADAVFHVDNHGANTYHLLEVSVRRPVSAGGDVAVIPPGYLGPAAWIP
jgi:hypothetical protein